MGNRRENRRARAHRRQLLSTLRPPVPTLLDIQADQAEISLFLSLQRFNRLIRDIKRSIYRRPQKVFKQKTYDTSW